MEAKFALLGEFYKDLLQPAVRNAGDFLGAATGIVLIPLTDWCKNNTKRFLADVDKKVSEIPDEHKQVPKTDLAVPLLKKAAEISEEDIRKMYTELLAKACDKRFNNKILPNYIRIIESLSAIEVQLLEKLNKGVLVFCKTKRPFSSPVAGVNFPITVGIPYLTVKLTNSTDGSSKILEHDYFSWFSENFSTMFSKDDFNLYLNSLIAIGVLEKSAGGHGSPYMLDYGEVEIYTSMEEKAKKEYRHHITDGKKITAGKRFIRVTPLGKAFLDVVYKK